MVTLAKISIGQQMSCKHSTTPVSMISMPRRYLALRVTCLSPHSLLINVIVL